MWAITVSRYRTQYPYIESVCNQGFRRRVYAETSKKKILGIENYRIIMRNTIQLRDWHEPLRGGGMEGSLYTPQR